MIDSHAHVTFNSFDDDRSEVIARARGAGVQWIEVGTDVGQSQKAVALARQHDGVWASVGVHPSDIDSLREDDWQRLEILLAEKKVVAVGEVGLDFYRGGILEQQLPVLRRFVSLAQERDLPVIFHVRSGELDAHGELIQFLRSLSDRERPAGVIHTYSGTQAQAEEYLALGMYLSFSGVVTFKNADEMAKVATLVPLDRLLIETDCPYLTPEPYRGKRNEPAYVALVAKTVARLRNVPIEKIQRVTEENARHLFSL